jgi:hypothetical protein
LGAATPALAAASISSLISMDQKSSKHFGSASVLTCAFASLAYLVSVLATTWRERMACHRPAA